MLCSSILKKAIYLLIERFTKAKNITGDSYCKGIYYKSLIKQRGPWTAFSKVWVVVPEIKAAEYGRDQDSGWKCILSSNSSWSPSGTNTLLKYSLLDKALGQTRQLFLPLTCHIAPALIYRKIHTYLFSQGCNRNRSAQRVHQPQRTDTFLGLVICTPLLNLNLDFQLMAW